MLTIFQSHKKTFNNYNLQEEYMTCVGYLLWVTQGTIQDLETITNILANHKLHQKNSHIKDENWLLNI